MIVFKDEGVDRVIGVYDLVDDRPRLPSDCRVRSIALKAVVDKHSRKAFCHERVELSSQKQLVSKCQRTFGTKSDSEDRTVIHSFSKKAGRHLKDIGEAWRVKLWLITPLGRRRKGIPRPAPTLSQLRLPKRR